MLAYVFLAGGAIEPFSRFAWPTPRDGAPGPWVSASNAPTDALRGYPADELPYWFDEELWHVELSGTVIRRTHVLLPERARLLGRFTPWSAEVAWEFVLACAQRVAERAAGALAAAGEAAAAGRLAVAADLEQLERAAAAATEISPAGHMGGYVTDICRYAREARLAARAAGVAAKMSAYALAGTSDEGSERVAMERSWQVGWLVRRLDLGPVTP